MTVYVLKIKGKNVGVYSEYIKAYEHAWMEHEDDFEIEEFDVDDME